MKSPNNTTVSTKLFSITLILILIHIIADQNTSMPSTVFGALTLLSVKYVFVSIPCKSFAFPNFSLSMPRKGICQKFEDFLYLFIYPIN